MARNILFTNDLSDNCVVQISSKKENKMNGELTKRNSSPASNVREQSSPTNSVPFAKDTMSLVLWRRPLDTLYYFFAELICLTRNYSSRLWKNKSSVLLFIIFLTCLFIVYNVQGPHQQYVGMFQKVFFWCAYWVGLGILSSVGLGTGLHTFLLYLGPHIAAVTLAAFECMSVNFPSPPYPDSIICPEETESSMSLWTIMSKVRLECMMWGAGTAIGELPPYFMARTAALSGQMDEEEREIEELIDERRKHPSALSFLDRAKVYVHDLVKKVGFVGILACASIPNPLFDLAGITCGHFLVPFWTFFGATLIGKAVIKMHIQKIFVIILFSEKHLERLVKLLGSIPVIGNSMQAPFMEYLQKQKMNLHKPRVAAQSEVSWLSWVFEKLVLVMVVYFVVSIINSLAQTNHKRKKHRESR